MTEQSGEEQGNLSGKRPIPTEEKRRRKSGAALLSIISNTLLVLLKLVVGYMSGSVSVLSEAAHSATDLMASLIAFFSVRVSDTPPDQEHPFGHGKIESISGLAEALLIMGAAGYIVHEAITKLRSPHAQAPPVGAGLAVMGLSVLANIAISRYLFRVAREVDSMALEADAEHLRTDIWTSVGVFCGLALVHITGHAWLDPVSALVVAVLIVRASYRLTRDAFQPLLDARLPAEEEAAIQEVLETDDRVLGYHKLRTRKSGSQRHADVHVQIDDNCTLVQAHALTEELEDQIRDVLPDIFVNIHTEPFQAEMRHQQEAHGVSNPMTEALLTASPPPADEKAEARLPQDPVIPTANTEERDASSQLSSPSSSQPSSQSSSQPLPSSTDKRTEAR